MTESTTERRAQRVCLWAGPATLLGFLLGGIVIGRFVPPFIAPSDSAAHVAAEYAEHADRTILGAMIAMIALACLTPWGVAVAQQTREKSATLARVQVASVAISVTIVMFMCLFWALAAFRAGDVDAETTRTLSDIAFFLIIWPYFPFSIWVASVGLAVLLDPDETPVYPRWVGYYSLWNALLYVPAGFMPFFKDGAVAWNGLFALYVPLGAFFGWVVIVTVFALRNVSRTRARTAAPNAASRASGEGVRGLQD